MNQPESLIVPFIQVRATDLPLVGGKGANLGELTNAGFPVPPGFCVTTIAFQQFLDACPQTDDLYTLMDAVAVDDVDGARRVGLHVRETLLTVPIPPTIVDAVIEEWRQFGPEKAFAVRSSATAEDLPYASFAGQQDTYLNVIGEAALLDAVRRCWVSLFTDRAIIYRAQNKFAHEDVRLSVVVQQMVMAETSGVLFTADPLTGHRHTVTIDASFGLGEALVRGIVSPDAYRVDKRDMTIIDRQISDKRITILPEKDGDVRQISLSDSQRHQTVLSDTQIVDLARMGARVESHFGSPQDLEWAIAGGRIHLVQARPITSLFPIDALSSPDNTLHVYFSVGHQQMMTGAMTPLGMSTIRVFAPLRKPRGAIETNVMVANGGRLYADVTPLLRHPIGRRIVFRVLAMFDALAPETFRLAMQRPEFAGPTGITYSTAFFRLVARVGRGVIASLCCRNVATAADDAVALIARDVGATRTRLAAIPAGEPRLRAAIDTLPNLMLPALEWIPTFIAGEIAKRLVRRMARDWDTRSALEVFDLGLPGNIVTDMNLALGDVADIARKSPQLADHFRRLGTDSATWLNEAADLDGAAPFFEAWDAFLSRYGSRGPAEFDLGAARWCEEPMPLLQVIAGYLQKPAGSQRAQQASMAVARRAAVDQLIARAGQGVLGRARVRVLKRLLHVVDGGSVLREHHKFLLLEHLQTRKEIVKETALLLSGAGILADPDDVWFFTWPELFAFYSDHRPDGRKLAQQRRAEFERFSKLTPPMVITSDGETPTVTYMVADAPPGALLGNPVAPGIVEGDVRVVTDPQAETVEPGEILVAPFTDPGWTPLFINAAGLVTEIGGMMTHGSVVAREYGIPAVVGVRAATTTLRTGQRVRLDGNRGVIEMLEQR